MDVGSANLASGLRRQTVVTKTNQLVKTVTTLQEFSAPVDLVWDALLFYEEITDRPSFVLRRFLPQPIGTAGDKSAVNDEVRCRYVGGHLIKRISQLTQHEKYAFEVTEQRLELKGIRLLGGDYTLFMSPKGYTRVALTTRYSSSNRPRWLYHWIEVRFCHSFHRYILRAMGRTLSHRSERRIR